MDHTYLKDSWEYIVSRYTPRQIDFWGSTAVQLVCFWGVCTTYLYLDKLFPNFSHRHKIQPIPKQPTPAEIRHCILYVAFNQSWALGLQFLSVLVQEPPGYRINPQLPSLWEFGRDFAISLLIREALFYYSHRLFHTPKFYAPIHKKHHKFTAPMAFTAEYAHPVEHLIANILPIVLPSMILRSHIIVYWAFLGFELIETATVHSGYDFFSGAAKKHDLHHEKFRLNYGAIGLLDWIHGTNQLKKKD